MLTRLSPLALLAAALCGVIARECVHATAPARRPPFIGARFAAKPLPAPAVDSAKVHAWADVILARPLFEPSRRPPAGTAKTTAAPRLTAIVIARQLQEAIFVLPGAPRAVVVTPGSHLDGMLIEGIAPTGVLVADGGGTRIMRPSFGNETSPPPPTRPAPFIDISGRPLFAVGNAGPPPPELGGMGGMGATASITPPGATGESP